MSESDKSSEERRLRAGLGAAVLQRFAGCWRDALEGDWRLRLGGGAGSSSSLSGKRSDSLPASFDSIGASESSSA